MSLGPEWFVVQQRGYDSSGRRLLATRFMWAVFDAIRDDPNVKPFAHLITPVQGAFMLQAGGGASASDGFHNYAGCMDIRSWNLTQTQMTIFINTGRRIAFGLYRRDTSWAHGGMSPHIHGTLGGDRPYGSGASVSWSSYVNGGDGLSGPGGDYEWRPSPLVTYPPAWVFEEDWMTTQDAATIKAQNKHTQDMVKTLTGEFRKFRGAEYERDMKEFDQLQEIADKQRAIATRVIEKVGGLKDLLVEISQEMDTDPVSAKAKLALLDENVHSILAEDPDIDGAENPA